MSELYQIDIERTFAKWEVPSPRAQSLGEVEQIVRAAIQRPFRRIVIDNVNHWNLPAACSVTFAENCPGKP